MYFQQRRRAMKRATIILGAAALAAIVFASNGYAQPPVLEILEIEGHVYAQVLIPELEDRVEIIISYTGLQNDETFVHANVPPADSHEELIPLGEAYSFDESRFVTVTIDMGENHPPVSRTWPEEAWVPAESWE